ncbi:MAG TPA: phosphatidylglycerophosphatase A [Acetobacteraceae bacterium]|nr:phosphatidylglycerophosphatase A [Acetobacteraceae bacterium]
MTLARLVAGGFGSGFVPFAPGTAGALLGLLLGVPLLLAPPGMLAIAALLVSLLGLWAIRAARVEGDPGWVVIDEIAGQFVALLGLTRPTIVGLAAAFALFRLFDIVKPGPVGWADRQDGAAGIMADDLIAGAIAAGVLWAARQRWPGVWG